MSLTLAQQPAHAASPPVLGTWQLVGTTPPGFVRHGAEVGRITITMKKGALHGAVLTGKHHYMATGRYIAAHHELELERRSSSRGGGLREERGGA